MESVRETNELADEPQEIALIIKDCADGKADEDITKDWIDRVKTNVKTCRELLEAVGVKELLKFVEHQLDPKCPADRDSEGMRILPSLIETLTRGI